MMKIDKIILALELAYLRIRAITWQEVIFWIKLQARIAHACLHEFYGKAKRSIWNRGLLLAWYRLWIRKDEFHKSLSLDPFAIRDMDEEEKRGYMVDLARRRDIAHQRDLQEDPNNKIVQQIIGKLGPPDADKIMRDVLKDASPALREIDEAFSLVGKKPDETLYGK